MVRQHDLDMFKSSVEHALIRQHNIDRKHALDMMNDSNFNDLLEDDPLFVAHYPPAYWANDIIEEYRLLNEQMLK